MKFVTEYRDSTVARNIVSQIETVSRKSIRLMEVCGTHTVSIFRSGIRSILPGTISLISGPGCPVCVTAQEDIDAFIELSRIDNAIVTTFGDLMRVPGTRSSLQREKANGRDIRIVYSAMDALDIAQEHPDRPVFFIGVGFETTAPTVAAAILTADRMKRNNFYVYAAHKRVPPALMALMSLTGDGIDGFILPGHVSVMIGTTGYREFFDRYQIPAVITGFEPTDILRSIQILVQQIECGKPALINAYERAVTAEGNPKALSVMEQVFETVDAVWRGIGTIPQSGLAIQSLYEAYDAAKQFKTTGVPSTLNPACKCGEILIGRLSPEKCPLYKHTCTPLNPYGPCMVSSEGTCAAYYRFNNA